ncbi:MAG: CotH kinase family protein [Clostridiales bacterium]|nr:CotH kinase family protein [Clostridiales bacterium]
MKIRILAILSVLTVLLAAGCNSQQPEQTDISTAETTETTAPAAVDGLQPQNGVPLLIIRIDESDSAIEAASAADGDHTYGNIDQMNESTDHSVRCVGTVEIIVPDGYTGEYGSSEVPAGEMQLDYIRGRGNTTWEYGMKKAYKIKVSEAADLFGMGASKEWGLMANYFDDTLLRNRITSWLGSQMSLRYTPQMVPVDVVMIGSSGEPKHLGSYFISELVGVEEARVDIPKLKKDDTAGSANITGGYLLSLYQELQNTDISASGWFATDTGDVKFINESPSFDSEDLSQGRSEQRDYIRQYVNRVDELIMSEGPIDSARHDQIDELLDLTSLADYWWIQEFSCNGDGFETDSTYLYKERDGKLYFGPLWDFDKAWNPDSNTGVDTEAGFNNTVFAWTDYLRENDPLFVELLRERWEIMDAKLEELTRAGGQLDSYRDEIRASHWEDVKINSETYNDGDEDNYDETVDTMRSWITARRSWVNDHLDMIGRVNFTITYEANGTVVDKVTARGNAFLENPPAIPAREGFLAIGWVSAEDGSDLQDKKVFGDMTFVPNYVAESEVEQPAGVYFRTTEVWAGLEPPYEYYPGTVTVYPQAAETLALDHAVWTSSDTDVAAVDPDGKVRLIAPGDAVITCTLFNGVSASYVMHVYDSASNPPAVPSSMTVTGSMDLTAGQSSRITYSLNTNGVPCGNYLVNYESSDPSVAEVDGLTGMVTAVAPGTATVTVRVEFTQVDNAVLTSDCVINVGN